MKEVDLFAIGGARVAWAESSRIGGTCVIRGCVPKKLMVPASRHAEDFDLAAGFGRAVGERRFDWQRLRGNVAAEGLPSAELANSSDEFFDWPSQPARVLRGFDRHLCAHLQQALLDSGMTILSGCTVTGTARRADGSLQAQLSDGSSPVVDAVLRATGRVPSTRSLGLEQVGVATTHGAIVANEWSQTSLAGVCAVGDVIPTAVFTTPEVGTVGLGEEAAAARFGAIDIYASRLKPMKHALAPRPGRMLMKVIVDRASDRVLGVDLVGPEAAEMIQLAGIALQMGATKAQFDAVLPVHPTAAEEILTLRLPVRQLAA